MANARVWVSQDVRVLVQEDASDAIVRGERAELERVTGMPAAPHDVVIGTAGEGTMFRNTHRIQNIDRQ